jgi:hypothetical protein
MTPVLDVASWRPGPLSSARREVAVARAVLDAASTALETPPSVTWSGAAAQAADAQRRGLVERVRNITDAATRLDRALDTAVERLTLLASVAAPSAASDLDAARAAAALRVANEIDADLTAALQRVVSDVASGAEAPPLAHGTVPLVGPDAFASAISPAWAIDHENRIRLDRAEVDLTAQVAALQSGPRTWRELLGGSAGGATIGTFGGGSRRVAYEEAVAKLGAVRATRQVLGQKDGRRRQLLAFDVSGRTARVAVAVGEVDRAEHIAVVVPGFTTTVERDLVGSDRLAADLADEARRAATLVGDRSDVAVVSWLGYDIPQTADTFRGSHSVVLQRSAEIGADALDAFLRGLPADRHLTLVGHSYGSTTAGIAAARVGTPVDDLVVLGSPGIGVDRTADLGVPAARVHVLEADDDPVADLGWFGPDPDSMPGVDRLGTGAARLPDGTEGEAAIGHSRYLAPGTTSQWNVAAVVAGAPLVRVGRPPTSW